MFITLNNCPIYSQQDVAIFDSFTKRFPNMVSLHEVLNDSIDSYIDTVNNLRARFSTMVIVGVGGSSLGARMLYAFAGGADVLSGKLIFMDSIDPDYFTNTLSSLDLHTTCFLLVSKSGNTSEVILQTKYITKYICTKLNKKPEDICKYFYAITRMDTKNELNTLCKASGIKTIAHHPEISGRFSCFSVVGGIPALFAGVNMHMVHEGAKSVLQNVRNGQGLQPAHAYIIHKSQSDHSVIMLYSSKLQPFGMWYRQLLAESLGKNNKEIAPLFSMGTADQHSMLQMYLEGRRNKFFTIIGMRPDCNAAHNTDIDCAEISKTLYAHMQATSKTLIAQGAPVRTIEFDAINAHAIGKLAMHCMLEVIFLGLYMQVNPFDQRAIESLKRQLAIELQNI